MERKQKKKKSEKKKGRTGSQTKLMREKAARRRENVREALLMIGQRDESGVVCCSTRSSESITKAQRCPTKQARRAKKDKKQEKF